MTFTVTNTIETRTGTGATWVEPGSYDVVRMINEDRILINLARQGEYPQLTIVEMFEGDLNP